MREKKKTEERQKNKKKGTDAKNSSSRQNHKSFIRDYRRARAREATYGTGENIILASYWQQLKTGGSGRPSLRQPALLKLPEQMG